MSGWQRIAVWLALVAALQVALAPRVLALGPFGCAAAHAGCCAPPVTAPAPTDCCAKPIPVRSATEPSRSHGCCADPAPSPAPDDGDCPCEHRDAPEPLGEPTGLPLVDAPVALPPVAHPIAIALTPAAIVRGAPSARPPDATGPPRYLRLCRFLI